MTDFFLSFAFCFKAWNILLLSQIEGETYYLGEYSFIQALACQLLLQVINRSMCFNKSLISGLIASHFPPVKAAWAYGSAVFPQSTSNNPSNLIDLFLIVDSSYSFHSSNLKLNPSHYSGLSSLLGAPYIYTLNKLLFPIHFNSHIDIDGVKIKYGIVESSKLKEDLTCWNYLTMAGRLHKPVKFLKGQDLYEKQLFRNLEAAMSYALLMTDNSDEQSLYEHICRLSYIGDIRYSVSLQNKNKVENIVKHNMESFKRLYHPVITRSFREHVRIEDGRVEISRSEESMSHYFNKLIFRGIQRAEELEGRIYVINRGSSLKMAFYNFLSSSLSKNLVYLSEKAKKSRKK